MAASTEDLQKDLQELRKEFEVQAATQGGAQATQAATQAGAQATQTAAQAGQMSTFAAAQAGTWSTIAAGWVAMVVGIFLGLAIANSRR
ncbi:MAG: hypothetical protein M3174_05115 [Actinomycetota bacterium]|nr:hypothetical protein [Actinomycetota bacterium]